MPEPPHLWANWPPLTIAVAATAKAASIATTAKTVPQMGIFLRSGIAIIAAKQVAIAFQSHFCRFWRSILRNVASSTALWVHLPMPRKFASFTLSRALPLADSHGVAHNAHTARNLGACQERAGAFVGGAVFVAGRISRTLLNKD